MKTHPLPGSRGEPGATIRPLEEADLPAADAIMRVAFGTFLGLPEPGSFMGDTSYVRTRWRAAPDAAFGVEVDGELVGSNFAANWGSVGFFGPLTIRPDLWDRGLGRRLMQPVLECFDAWGTEHAGLFTFAHSQKHVGLYQKFGFWPRFLTAILSKPVEQSVRSARWTAFSEVQAGERASLLHSCRELTDDIYAGLDVSREVNAVDAQELGDTVLCWRDAGLIGVAICHCGPGTEAGSGTCYVKFGATRPGPRAARDFGQLLDACEEFASRRGLARMCAGVNTARHDAYRTLLARGYRTDFQGVTMHRPNEPGYDRPDVYVIDDWR